MSLQSRTYDVAVIGSGLSGLFAGLFLQRQGLHVLILERRSSVGGLCGTFDMDGYEFVIACNDFGQGMVQAIKELQIPVCFEHKKTQIFHRNRRYVLPLSGRSALHLLPYLPEALRLFRELRRARATGEGSRSLGDLVDAVVTRETARDLLKLPSYLMGVRPEDFKVASLWEESQYQYGYSKPAAPVGGPQVLADALAQKFLSRGSILLSTQCHAVQHEGEGYTLRTSAGGLRARAVLSTAERKDAYPPDSKQGLPVSMFCVAVSKMLPYPRNTHTLVHYPPAISQWFGRLDAGLPSPEFGFHLFRSELPEKPDHYTLNIYFYLPRGEEEPDDQRVRSVQDYILSHAERMLPGLRQAILYTRFLSPRMFTERHGLSSRVTPLITRSGVGKAPNHDPQTGLYYAGNSVFPPGDHAGAAVLSARMCAEMIAAKLSTQTERGVA